MGPDQEGYNSLRWITSLFYLHVAMRVGGNGTPRPQQPQRHVRKTPAESNSWNRKDSKKEQAESCLSLGKSGLKSFLPKETPRRQETSRWTGRQPKGKVRIPSFCSPQTPFESLRVRVLRGHTFHVPLRSEQRPLPCLKFPPLLFYFLKFKNCPNQSIHLLASICESLPVPSTVCH